MKHRLLTSLLVLLLALLPAMPVRAGGGALPDSRDVPAPLAADDTADEAPYTLSAPYPNPFRTRTRFDLRVQETQHVSVEVYNILGQRVRTLYEGAMRRDDKRTFTFEARGLPSGLYLYRISGETFTAARRITLVR